MLGGESGVKWQCPAVTPAMHLHYLDVPYLRAKPSALRNGRRYWFISTLGDKTVSLHHHTLSLLCVTCWKFPLG